MPRYLNYNAIIQFYVKYDKIVSSQCTAEERNQAFGRLRNWLKQQYPPNCNYATECVQKYFARVRKAIQNGRKATDLIILPKQITTKQYNALKTSKRTASDLAKELDTNEQSIYYMKRRFEDNIKNNPFIIHNKPTGNIKKRKLSEQTSSLPKKPKIKSKTVTKKQKHKKNRDEIMRSMTVDRKLKKNKIELNTFQNDEIKYKELYLKEQEKNRVLSEQLNESQEALTHAFNYKSKFHGLHSKIGQLIVMIECKEPKKEPSKISTNDNQC
eukprot:246683_1